jgi:predicted transcriptional regulator
MIKIKVEEKFIPSVKIMTRILKEIFECNSVVRTDLAIRANVNYAILSKHLHWLKNRSIIESIIINEKINVRLTKKGRLIVLELNKLEEQIFSFTD